MPTSYEQEILKIHQTVGVLEKLGYHEAWALAKTIKLAKEAVKRASKPGNPPSPYDFKAKELQLLDYCWFFCCNFLAKSHKYKSTNYGVPDKEYKYTKKVGDTLLTALKEVALAPGTVRPTNIKLSQITDNPELKKIIQLAESSNKSSILITAYGYNIAASNGRKAIASDENQLKIENPPTELIIKLNATQN